MSSLLTRAPSACSAIVIFSGCKPRQDFKPEEILFTLQNVNGFGNISSICLLRNTLSYFHDLGTAPSSPEEGTSLGVSDRAPHRHGHGNHALRVSTNGLRKTNIWWEKTFLPLNPSLWCISTWWPKSFSPSLSPVLPSVLAGAKVAPAAGERSTVHPAEGHPHEALNLSLSCLHFCSTLSVILPLVPSLGLLPLAYPHLQPKPRLSAHYSRCCVVSGLGLNANSVLQF